MNTVEIIPASSFKTSYWSGGTTTELFIWPQGSSYAERRFKARISSAFVELSESVFTPLPGVKRFLTPLCRGFSLTVNGKNVELLHGGVLEFSGGDDVTCRGSGRDLNLMLKGCVGSMSIVSGGFGVSGGMAFIYSESGGTIRCTLSGQSTEVALAPNSFTRLHPAEYRLDHSAVLFIILPS